MPIPAPAPNPQWTRLTSGQQTVYVLQQDDAALAELHVNPRAATRVHCRLAGRHYTLQAEGFWTVKTLVFDDDGICVAEATPTQIRAGGRTYRLHWDNAPMARLSLLPEGQQPPADALVAYALDAGRNARTVVRFDIRPQLLADCDGLLLAALLWHQYLPVAMESVEFAQ